MQWILLSLLSAVFLGLYDVAKKTAVHENAVPPVLLLNVSTAATVWLLAVMLMRTTGYSAAFDMFKVEYLDFQAHVLLAAKSCLVSASWTFAFFALKHLPISIATPIRATSPFWTIAIAISALGERPNTTQCIGITLILAGFFLFSRVGRVEGIHFHRNRWVACMLAATILGSLSALYDKYLLQTAGFSPATVQFWFSVYLVPATLPLFVRWYYLERRKNPFRWRKSIPAIAVALLIADFLYFSAVGAPDALISVISPVRRTAVVIPFLVGILWLREKNPRRKAVCIGLMLLGVYLVSIS